MENEFLPYELAVEMKSIGFDEPCLGYFASKDAKTIRLALWTHIGYVNANRLDDDLVTAPLYQQIFSWAREKHHHYAFLQPTSDSISENYCFKILDQYSGKFYSKSYETYEKAELECVKKLIEILKQTK
jgi:hypothetical protein